MLDAGHENVKLSTAELERLSAWIDLGVPFAGDYREAAAWSADERAKYEHYLAKRKQLAADEARNIAALAHGDGGDNRMRERAAPGSKEPPSQQQPEHNFPTPDRR
jgi:hypothetical protein